MTSISASLRGAEEALRGDPWAYAARVQPVAAPDHVVELMTGVFRVVNGMVVHIRQNMGKMPDVPP